MAGSAYQFKPTIGQNQPLNLRKPYGRSSKSIRTGHLPFYAISPAGWMIQGRRNTEGLRKAGAHHILLEFMKGFCIMRNKKSARKNLDVSLKLHHGSSGPAHKVFPVPLRMVRTNRAGAHLLGL